MLATKVISSAFPKKNLAVTVIQGAKYSSGGFYDERAVIGKREWVGYGINGSPNYVDRSDFPMPAVRFREITGDLVALREKEKGDWKKLTLEEKKKLYRASFCQTLAEEGAPTGQWKSIVGFGLGMVSLGILLFIWEKKYVYRPLPPSFSEEWRRDNFRRMIDLKENHLTGLASKWDYEKDDWK